MGFSINSSSESRARSEDVCGVMEVDVNEAAAFPVVCLAALYGTAERFELEEDEPAPDFDNTVEERGAAGLWFGSDDFAARALATAAFAARILAEEPVAERLMLFRGFARSASCSSVKVEVPSLRYLKLLMSRFERLWGSCRVMISFRPNSSSLTRSLQCFGLMFSLSTVSHANTFPLVRNATIWVLSVNTLKVTGSQYSPSSFLCMFSFNSSEYASFSPVMGLVPCFFSHGMMLVRSKIAPSVVHTGCVKGWSESEQKL